MKKTTILVFNFLFIIISIIAQTNNICAYGDNINSIENCLIKNIGRFQYDFSDREANKIVGKIVEQIGVSKNFIISKCDNISNCLAVTDLNGDRLILYDKDFLNKIDLKSNTDWASFSILAHEVGHHLQGHTISAALTSNEKRKRELEADKFSGFIMNKLGASLFQAKAALKTFEGQPISSTHPSIEQRLLAIEKGYNQADQERFELIEKMSQKLIERVEIKYYDSAAEKYNNKNFNGCIKDLDFLLEFKPNYIKALELRAECYYHLDQFQKSITDLESIYKSTDSKIVLFQIIRSHIIILGRNGSEIREKEEYLNKAKQKLGEYSNKYSNDIYWQFAYAELTYNANSELAKDYIQDAINSFSKISKRYDKYGHNLFSFKSHLYFMMSKINTINDEFEQALINAKKSIYFDKTNSNPYQTAGRAYESLGEHRDSAEYYYNKAVEYTPTNLHFKALLASFYLDEGSFEKAKPIVDSILIIQPDHKHAISLDAFIKVYRGKEEDLYEAIYLTTNVIKNYPEEWHSRYVRGLAYTFLGNCGKAKEDLEFALNQHLLTTKHANDLNHLKVAMQYTARCTVKTSNNIKDLKSAYKVLCELFNDLDACKEYKRINDD